MKLKLKALLYRYTGIYLAHKEELEVVDQYLRSIYGKKLNEISFSIHIGMWQAHNGFTTIWCRHSGRFLRLKYSRYKLLYGMICAIELFVRQLCCDLERTVFRYWHNKKIDRLQKIIDSIPKKAPKKARKK